MTVETLDNPLDLGRSKRLKAATGATHERLDTAIMAGKPFASFTHYGRFLDVQHGFHREIDALYGEPRLGALLPDLASRRRLALIVRDMADIGLTPRDPKEPPTFADGAAVDLPTALGWLYVAEGSNLGAAFLLKQAEAFGLSSAFGARHLAAAPEGRGLHWKTFVAVLDAVRLTPEEEARVIAGAEAAFARVQGLVRKSFG
ncbi:biliverdin-producing heme oxygenase [Methylopila musalis]|uniref:Biliverdin-producing heme oxygenase n=1 Tax=Methylopila musalis TaxID=1134781 RepID=A0ABW3Z343_9HYPH